MDLSRVLDRLRKLLDRNYLVSQTLQHLRGGCYVWGSGSVSLQPF